MAIFLITLKFKCGTKDFPGCKGEFEHSYYVGQEAKTKCYYCGYLYLTLLKRTKQ